MIQMADVGRPSKYSESLALELCARVARGMSLKSICEMEDMPHMVTILRWLRDDVEFRSMYARAKDDAADALADDILDLADRVLTDEIDANSARVAIDAKKWVAAKLKPRKYGDKIDMTTNGKDLPTPIYNGLSQVPDKVTDKKT